MGILDTMAGNVAGNLNKNGLLMRTAEAKGMQQAASRGLKNSTLGIEASQRAMLDAALPIAQIDTANKYQEKMQNQQNQFTANQASLDRSHQLGMQTKQQEFAAGQAGLDRSHQLGMQTKQQEFAAGQAGLDRSHQITMAGVNHDNSMKMLNAQVAANTIGKSIDFVQQITGNFDAQIAGILNNTNMQANDKQNAINQLKASRDSEIKFMTEFMQKIPTTHQNWSSFPSLGVPTVSIG